MREPVHKPRVSLKVFRHAPILVVCLTVLIACIKAVIHYVNLCSQLPSMSSIAYEWGPLWNEEYVQIGSYHYSIMISVAFALFMVYAIYRIIKNDLKRYLNSKTKEGMPDA